MNSGDLERFLREGLKLQKVKRLGNGWIEAACPFASGHSGGRDKNPSFGVRIGVDRSSHYRCQGCHAKGGLLDLVWRLAPIFGTDAKASSVFSWVVSHDHALVGTKYLHEKEAGVDKNGLPKSYPFSLPDVPFTQTEGKVPMLIPLEAPAPTVLPEADLEKMQEIPAHVMAYLRGPKRRLTDETIKAWEIGFNAAKNRISIPIRDSEGRLVGISGRLLEDGKRKGPKYLHSRGFRRDFFLYGEHKVIPGRVGYAVEGFFDVIGLWQDGYMNGVGIFGSSPSTHQIEKMVKLFSSVVVLGDGDKAGREMAEKTYNALRPFLPVSIAELPEGKDPDNLSLDEKIELLGPPYFDNCDTV